MESLGGLLFPLLILLLFIPIFLSGRKQRRQMQNMQQLQASLQVDDVVYTTSGLRGTVVDTQYEDSVDLEIAPGVTTTWLRAAIREKASDAGAPEPGNEAASGADGASLDGSVDRSTTTRTDSAAEPVADAPRDANGTSRP